MEKYCRARQAAGISKLQDENMYAKRLEESVKQLTCIGGETIQEEWDICKSTIQHIAEEVRKIQITTKKTKSLNKDCKMKKKKKNEAYLIMQQQHGTRNKVLRYQEKRKEEKKIHKKRK
jgi:3-deoxy-D-manno-octulosonic-acid transferase